MLIENETEAFSGSSFFLGKTLTSVVFAFKVNTSSVKNQVNTTAIKIKSWASIFGDHLEGPFFLPGNLTG